MTRRRPVELAPQLLELVVLLAFFVALEGGAELRATMIGWRWRWPAREG